MLFRATLKVRSRCER